MTRTAALLRLLGDEARLRLLRLVALERLNVSELTSILGLAQSGVSRHLGLLKDAGLVEESREGGFAFYRLASGNGHAEVLEWLQARFEADADATALADASRLAEVLRLRKERFQTDLPEQRRLMPGRSWAAWARALGHLLPPLRVADLGCGEGYLAVEAAGWAASVTAVDRSPEALKAARALAARRGVTNITWRKGDFEHLPLRDDAYDVVLLSQALHHAVDPRRALVEAVRIAVADGTVLVLDLRAHDQAWVREQLGDHWLGFDDEQLEQCMRDAGLEDVRVSVGARQRGDPFTVLIASGKKPRAGGAAASSSSSATRKRGPARVARAGRRRRTNDRDHE